MSADDGLTMFYRLTDSIPGHAAGEVLALCEYHLMANYHQTRIESRPELPAPGSCQLCAEELADAFPVETTGEDDQRDEDERNYCAIVQAGIDRMRR